MGVRVGGRCPNVEEVTWPKSGRTFPLPGLCGRRLAWLRGFGGGGQEPRRSRGITDEHIAIVGTNFTGEARPSLGRGPRLFAWVQGLF